MTKTKTVPAFLLVNTPLLERRVGFMLFALYMLAATIKGCFKFGTRFFLVSLHPMKYNGTYMNSFLFNVSLFLLCSFPTAQLSASQQTVEID